MTPDPTCPRCNGSFVEIIEEASSDRPQDFDDEADNPFAPVFGDPYPGFSFRTGQLHGESAGPGGPQGIGGGLGGLLMALALGVARDPHASSSSNPQSPSSPTSPNNRSAPADQHNTPNRGASHTDTRSGTRSGTSSFGPFGVQWNVQYGSGGGDPYQRAAQHQAEHNHRQQQQQQQQQEFRSPPTLSNFLRFAFGSDSANDHATANDAPYFHDDGMGGAGGAADGRHFNHDNRGTYHQPPQSPNHPSNDLPPELSALRNLFTGLFGEPGAPGGSFLDMLGAGAQGGGPRGQWGDYVLGQQGLDDIISQMMEQTQGSNAPPPASEDVIDKLERFTLADTTRIQKAKNQDCPTCKDDFLPLSGTPAAEEKPSATGSQGEEDDQQQELMSMPCGHIFHVDCLVPWLRLHGTCPVCRISIAKPEDGENEDTTAPRNTSMPSTRVGGEANSIPDGSSSSVPGGWPSPPNPFTSFFSQLSGRQPTVDETVRVSTDPPGSSTTTYQTQPPASTTLTSMTVPSPVPSPDQTGPADVEVVNSIVSSPPIVSDREEFFAQRPQAEHSGNREDMRETLRRAAEARAHTHGGGQSRQHRALEPDELD